MKSFGAAPGKPGVTPHWTTSRKSGVGTARNPGSHVWFTTSNGILSEIYYPRIDRASVKDMGMLVTNGEAFFSEEKTGTDSDSSWLKDGVPGVRLSNTCKQRRYVIEKTIVTDPNRHVLLQNTRFEATGGRARDYRLYVLLAPHLSNRGAGNDARVGEYKGIPMLLAECDGYGLALACSAPWLLRSAGYIGVSDGWQDLHAHKRMTSAYEMALDGNVALTGEIDLSKGTEFVLALGFGRTANEAAHRARLSLSRGFEAARQLYEKQWTEWQSSLRPLASSAKANASAYRVSTAVLATHESKDFPGGTIASLSFPWGQIQGDEDRGGYHLVWPRDAYETVSALLAAGRTDEILRALDFFQTVQESDGHWPQNMWLDGTSYWKGIQLDEVAAPLLLLDLARRNEKIDPAELERFWPMVRAAAAYLVQNGPSSPQDRWEENAGLTPYTLACLVAALLVAAEVADANREPALALYLRETADAWNESIERWLYVEDTPLAREVGIGGYYARLAPPRALSGQMPLIDETIEIANRPAGETTFKVNEVVSTDALALVRFGLRAASDPRIVNTALVIDAVLKVATPHGPCWRRYNQDGYGEHADGTPFDGTGIGRCWPLLVGERAHYELAAGNDDEARRLLGVMEAFAGDTGMMSEQVWDTDPIPERDLFPGRPTGSAQPLVWAHAEHIKLLRSLSDGVVFDTPPQPVKRYVTDKQQSTHAPWRFEGQVQELCGGQTLRIETRAAARVRWTVDGWQTFQDTESRDFGIGLFVTDLPTTTLASGTSVAFTCYWPDAARWEGKNCVVVVGSARTPEGKHHE
jgi:glucoamylase